MRPSYLAATMTALETAAGATTVANDNESGRWKRIAAAAETLAGATTSANATPSGYRLRTAIALESIAGTDGNEENRNETGLLKRIADALEVQSGQVLAGSLEYRIAEAAANATFSNDAQIGHELVDDPAFAGTGSIVGSGGGSISGGAGNLNGGADARLTVVSLETLVPGTYRVTLDVENLDGNDLLIASVGGNPASIPGSDGTGLNLTVDIVVAVVGDQNLFIRGPSTSAIVDNWRVSRIA